MMFKLITITGCTKSGKLCSSYPTKPGYDKENKKSIYIHPDTYKITEDKRPDCFYCNRATEKEKKDRYKA